MKAVTLLIFTLFSIIGYSQNTINKYKYVRLAEKFAFSRFEDQYGVTTTTKLLLEKKGFVVVLGNHDLPPAVAANPCNALKADVVERNGLFVTRLTLLLQDCQGNTIFKSKEGKSSEKEYPVAYDQALKDAFTSLDAVPYNYDSTQLTQPQTQQPQPQQTQPLQPQTPQPQPQQPQLQQPQSQQPQPQQPQPQLQQPQTPQPQTPQPQTPQPQTQQTQTQQPQSQQPQQPLPQPSPPVNLTGTLYAQPTPNGYQLVDTTPKKIITLLKTSVQDYFIADAGGKNGIVFKRNGEWFFERYEDNKLVSQKLDIKF